MIKSFRFAAGVALAAAMMLSCTPEEALEPEENVHEETVAEIFETRASELDIETITIEIEKWDNGLFISFNGIGILIPAKIESIFELKFPLYLDREEIGYLAIEKLENPDYTTGYYPVVHFIGSDLTLSFYDGTDFFDLLKDLIGWD